MSEMEVDNAGLAAEGPASVPQDPQEEENLLLGLEDYEVYAGDFKKVNPGTRAKIANWFAKRLKAALRWSAQPASYHDVVQLSKLTGRTKRKYYQACNENPELMKELCAAAEEDVKIVIPEEWPEDAKQKLNNLLCVTRMLKAQRGEHATLAAIAAKDLRAAHKTMKELREALAARDEEQKNLFETNRQLNEDKAQLEGRMASLTAEAADWSTKYQEQLQKAAGLQGKTLASALAKPPEFSGKGLLGKARSGQQVEDWVRTVQRYATALKLNDYDTVSVAASLLREEAARAWLATEGLMQASNQEITLADVRECLVKRFTPAATVASARGMLDSHKQAGQFKDMASYVAEFDRICSLIPDLGLADKIHRFIVGLDPRVVLQVSIDPLTGVRHTNYERMRTAALNCAAETLDDARQILSNPKNHPSKRPKHQHQQGNGGSGGGGGGGGGGNKQQQPQQQAKKGAAGSNGGNKQFKAQRTPAVVAFCKANNLCMNCYTKNAGHTGKECPNPPASGFPQGFVEGQ